MSMILALPCAESVITPACEPVNDCALWPSCAIAIATSAIEIRSPAVSSMSSSRGGGSGVTCSARSRRSSVVSPMAETTTTTSLPALRVLTMRCATRLMPVASATDDPPYFCTTMPTVRSLMLEVCPRAILSRLGIDRFEHLIGDGEQLLLLDGGVRVEAVVGDHREQRVERGAGEVAPRGDVGELPPPQRLVDVAEPVVAQPVLEVGGDAGQVVGELALDDLGDVGVEDEGVGVQAAEQVGQRAAASRRGRPRARRRAGTPRSG